jgi:cardiolipin synthase
VWTRAHWGQGWRAEVVQLVRSAEPVRALRALARQLKMTPTSGRSMGGNAEPVRAAFVVRDNFRQRRAIERTLVDAFRSARQRIDVVTPYFYPGHRLRRTLISAARRGVRVRLLLQGKVDYRLAGLAARVLYAELLAAGVEIYEYTPAFLHAKMALVDSDWVTVGSSNIDPLSLLLNLEANVVVVDQPFAAQARAALDVAIAESTRISVSPMPSGWMGWATRALVAWLARWYLRMAGQTHRY